ncbi:MAG TPA: hypothetical protein VGE74_23425 [Gemmata sp.]
MNRFRLILAAAVLCPLVGCEWMKQHGIGTNLVKDRDGPRELRKVTPETLVGYLNTQADRLQSITQADVRVTARDRNIPMPPLRGSLVASQPRNFRMVGDAAMAAKVDLGSNDQQFWVYAKVPTADPMFVFASHTDFEAGKAKIPGGIPFEPEWVMQAFGMAHFPLNQPPEPSPGPAPGPPRGLSYGVKPDERARTYTLSWSAVTPSGAPVVKEIVFEADDAYGNKPQVKKHIVRDTKGKVICSAEIKEARTVQLGGADPRSGHPLTVQYPTRIVLRWEEQKFEMELELLTAKINQPPTQEEARRYFNRPNIPGATPIDLARYEFSRK